MIEKSSDIEAGYTVEDMVASTVLAQWSLCSYRKSDTHGATLPDLLRHGGHRPAPLEATAYQTAEVLSHAKHPAYRSPPHGWRHGPQRYLMQFQSDLGVPVICPCC